MLNLKGKLVLVVEDDEMCYLYLKQIFNLTGCSLLWAESGKEALDLFRDNHFDIILMDIRLPDIDGTQVTREIRLSDRDIPIIAQTAGNTMDEVEKAMEAGCSEVLVKPFTMETLFGAISRHYGNGITSV